MDALSETDPDHDAIVSLGVMLDAVRRDARDFFRMGRMRARKALANGAVVTITITMPTKRRPSSAVCPTCCAPIGRACVQGTWSPPRGGNTRGKPHPARLELVRGATPKRSTGR